MTFERPLFVSLLTASLAFGGCKVNDADDGAGGAGGGGDTSAATTTSGGEGGGQGGGVPSGFLPIPSEEGSFHAVVDGGGWTGFDRDCAQLLPNDSFYSAAFGNAYLFADSTDCPAADALDGLFQLRLAEGGLAAGTYPIAVEDGNVGQVSICVPDYPCPESRLVGELYIETADIGAEETLIAASYYGTTRWRDSVDDESSEADVTVQVALRVRVRTVETE